MATQILAIDFAYCSVVAGVGFSPPRSVNLPFCHLGLLKGRFSSL